MRPLGIVGVGPVGHGRAGVGQCREQHLVQKIDSEAPVGAFDEPILNWPPPRDEVPVDRRALAPRQDRGRGELCPSRHCL